jgi:hypothetical protein
MMISPEGYYEEYLRGKTKEQVMTVIRGLKQEIGRIKHMMESGDYEQEIILHHSEDARLFWTREYLKRAKMAYAEVGGTYTLSKSEEKAADFDLNINFIYKIIFIINDDFGGYRSFEVDLSNELRAYTEILGVKEPFVLIDANSEEPFTMDTFVATLETFHIGEWRRRYSSQCFGYTLSDGTQWKLEFEYCNGHKPIRFEGENSTPYNFDRLKMIFGIGETEEDYDE